MKLSDFLEANKLKPADFAKRIGTSRACVERYVAGERVPRPAIMKKIATATRGAVGPVDFYPTTKVARAS
jgi:transcriptional regulator with XRE-family HTH domain